MAMAVRIEQTRLVISSIPVDKETLRGCLLSLCGLWHISLCVIFAFVNSGIFATREISFIVVCHVSLARSCVPTALLTNSNGLPNVCHVGTSATNEIIFGAAFDTFSEGNLCGSRHYCGCKRVIIVH